MPANKPKKKSSEPSKPPQAFLDAQWKPGQSGNPSGRPKKKPITEMFEKMLDNAESHEAIRNAMLKIFSERSGIAKVMLLGAMADRVEGKVSQPIEGDINIAVTISDKMAKARERRSNG